MGNIENSWGNRAFCKQLLWRLLTIMRFLFSSI